MTRKDYVLLANALRSTQPSLVQTKCEQWREDVEAVALALRSDNPRFDRQRFLNACDYAHPDTQAMAETDRAKGA